MTARRVSLDYLNVLAMVGVVWLHTRIHFYWPANTPGFWFELVVSAAFDAAVPLFLMISGANLLDFPQRYSLREYLKKRVLRVGVPYLAWTQIYMVLSVLGHKVTSVTDWIKATLNPSMVAPPLWYIEVLLGLYLVIPLFAYLVQALGERWRNIFRYTMWLSIAATLVLPPLRTAWQPTLGSFEIPLAGYLMFVLVGYYLAHTPLERGTRIALYLAGVLGWVLFIGAGGPTSLAGSPFAPYFTGYLTFGALAMAAAFFVFAGQVCRGQWRRVDAWARRLASLTFGIYLVHYAVLIVVQDLRPIGGVLEGLGYAAFAWSLSALITLVGQRIPVVGRWLLP